MGEIAHTTKISQFRDFLKENKIESFKEEAKLDCFDTVVFRTDFDVNGKLMPLLLFLDKSIYTIVKIFVIQNAVSEKNREKTLEHINNLNAAYKIFKYSINIDSDVVLDIAIPSDKSFFDAKIIITAIELAISHLKEEYVPLTKVVLAAE